MSETETRWLKAQVASGAVFAAFLFVHLVNQMVAALGAAPYDGLQRGLQRGYQAAPVELALVFAPLLVHLFVTAVRVVRRPRQGQLPPRARLHRWAGRFLALVIIGHVAATRGLSLVFGVFPGFAGVAFTFQWQAAYFWPYYLLLGVAGWYHLVHGLSTAAAVFRLPGATALARPAVFRGLVGAGALALLLGVLGFGGVLADVGDPGSSSYARTVLRLASGAPPDELSKK